MRKKNVHFSERFRSYLDLHINFLNVGYYQLFLLLEHIRSLYLAHQQPTMNFHAKHFKLYTIKFYRILNKYNYLPRVNLYKNLEFQIVLLLLFV